jgi:hypothetical protein
MKSFFYEQISSENFLSCYARNLRTHGKHVYITNSLNMYETCASISQFTDDLKRHKVTFSNLIRFLQHAVTKSEYTDSFPWRLPR